MKFAFKDVSPNNEKFVAVFSSEDQSCTLSIVSTNSSDFAHFKAGSFFTVEPVIEPVIPTE